MSAAMVFGLARRYRLFGWAMGLVVVLLVGCGSERLSSYEVHVERLLDGHPPQAIVLPWGFPRSHLAAPTQERFRLWIPPHTQALGIGRTLGDVTLLIPGEPARRAEYRGGPERTLLNQVLLVPQADTGQWAELWVRAPAGYRGELGPVFAGTAEMQAKAWAQRSRQTAFQLVLAGLGLSVALAAVLYAAVRPGMPMVLYLAAGGLLLGGRNVFFVLLGVPDALEPAGQFLVCWNLITIHCLVGYCLRLIQPTLTKIEMWMWAGTALNGLAILQGWHIYEWLRWVLLAQGVLGMGAMAVFAWQRGAFGTNGLLTLLVVTVSLQVLSLLINMARYGTPFTADALQMPLVMGPLFLLAWGFGLARRFDQLISHYQTLNESLQSQVESKTGELLKLFASMQQKDRQKTLADERARLMQEMHDGLGARVTAALHILRREQVAPAAAAALDEALTDMRLIMDALEPNDGDLATILGNLRYRLEPRLQAAGLQLVWDVEPLEQPVELTASDVLHLQRIVEEALTNALKHSGSDRVVLSLRHDQQAGTADIGVQDFGGPLADVIALNTRVARQGHGVANMTARAERIGALIDFHRNEFGTLVLLKLPTKKL